MNRASRTAQIRATRLIGGLLLSLPAASLPGCGEAGPPRVPVSGEVRLDERPLPTGQITFLPTDRGEAASGEIQEGAFHISSSGGPSPGTYKVEILTSEPTGKKVPHPDLPGETLEEVRNTIPPQYNVKTQLEVEVKKDDENSFRFELASRRTPVRGRRR